MHRVKSLIKRIERSINTRKAYKFFIKDWVELRDLKTCSVVVGTMRFSRNLEPLELAYPTGKRLVIIAPHPDDEILGSGGTLIKAIRAGAKILTIYLTSGKLADQTETEIDANKVADMLGYRTEFIRLPIGDISLDRKVLEQVSGAIRAMNPDCLFIPFLFDDHDDHRRASELFMAMVRANLLDTTNLEVWGYQVYTALLPNVIVEITEVAEHKAEAMRLFSSQNRSRDWAHYILGLNAFNCRFLTGSPGPRYAECFFVVPAEEYVRLCEVYFKDPKAAYYKTNYTREDRQSLSAGGQA